MRTSSAETGPSTSAAIMSQARPMMRPMRPSIFGSNEWMMKSNGIAPVSMRYSAVPRARSSMSHCRRSIDQRSRIAFAIRKRVALRRLVCSTLSRLGCISIPGLRRRGSPSRAEARTGLSASEIFIFCLRRCILIEYYVFRENHFIPATGSDATSFWRGLKEATQMAHAVDDKGAVARTGGGVRPLSSALKTLALLDLLGDSDQPLSLAEMTRAAGESRATIYQKLVTLVHAGWIEQTDQGSYRLSLHAARMSDAALKQASLGERSTAILQELVHEVGETASLAVLSDVHARLVKRIEAEVMVRADVRVGTLLSLDNSSSGRVLTAFATPELRARL